MKKILTFIMAVILLVALPGTVLASADTEEDAAGGGDIGIDYTYIAFTRNGFSISANGLASCEASIQCYSGITKIKISSYLQRYDDGWQTVNHWTEYTYDDYATFGKCVYVASGYTYRHYVFFYAYIGGSVVESTSSIVYDSY